MTQNVFELEDNFQQYLRKGDYTFVGPVNQNLLEDFIKAVNLVAPVVSFNRTIHDALSNREAVRLVLSQNPNLEKRIYAIINEDTQILIHATPEEYCERLNINRD